MSTVVQESSGGIPDYLAHAFRQIGEHANALYKRGYAPYPNVAGRFAPLSTELQKYLRMVAEQEGEGQFDRAQGLTDKGLQKLYQNYDRYAEPYQQEVVNRLDEAGRRNANTVENELAKTFGQGQYSRHKGFERELKAEHEEEMKRRHEEALGRGHQLIGQGFGLDKARELEAASALNKLGVMRQAAKMADAQSLRDTGLLRYENTQRGRDLEYERWKEHEAHPHEALVEYFNILRGVPYVRSAYERREATQPYQRMHGQDWMGVGFDALTKLLAKSMEERSNRSNSPLPLVSRQAWKNLVAQAQVEAQGMGPGKRKERKEREEKLESERIHTIPSIPSFNPLTAERPRKEYVYSHSGSSSASSSSSAPALEIPGRRSKVTRDEEVGRTSPERAPFSVDDEIRYNARQRRNFDIYKIQQLNSDIVKRVTRGDITNRQGARLMQSIHPEMGYDAALSEARNENLILNGLY
jgi:hypothetical protein